VYTACCRPVRLGSVLQGQRQRFQVHGDRYCDDVLRGSGTLSAAWWSPGSRQHAQRTTLPRRLHQTAGRKHRTARLFTAFEIPGIGFMRVYFNSVTSDLQSKGRGSTHGRLVPRKSCSHSCGYINKAMTGHGTHITLDDSSLQAQDQETQISVTSVSQNC